MSALLFVAASISDVGAPAVGKADIIIRSREGNGVSTRQWIIKGALKDGRPVVFTFDFLAQSKTIRVGLVVAGKSWGEQLIDESKYPMIDVASLGLNQFQEHIEAIFDYGPEVTCPGGIGAELTVDFTASGVRLVSQPAECP